MAFVYVNAKNTESVIKKERKVRFRTLGDQHPGDLTESNEQSTCCT
jgi:hypothetical protein